MKLRVLLWFFFLPLFCLGADQRKLDLGQLRDWTIVVGEEAIPSEKYAAEELRGLLERALGFALPIQSKAPQAAHNIFVGASPALAASSVAAQADDLGDEGLRIRIAADNLAIVGGRPRGTLYGVYEFAERYLGVRFLTYDHTYVPKRKSFSIPCETWQYVPTFTFRWSYYHENAEHPEFAARLHVNTVTHSDQLGGVTPQSLISHSLGHLLPVSQYGKEHPEYFALVDGQRKLEMGGGGPELCVSNPEVIEIVAQNVIKDLDAHPHQKNISVSQNDNAAYCRCEKCEAINRREGTPMGSHLAFVNAVAERVARKYPDVKIGTLAYWYTRKAPRTIKPRANVQIQLCSIECSTLYPLDDPGCTKNQSFCEDMTAWGQICDDIWIWNYNTNFRYYDLPFPNLRVITPNLRYFLHNKVKGVFMQANGNGSSGEMCDLRNYVIARCLWHPELDSWEVAKEFCRLHYGEAGPTLIDYLTYLHDNALRAGYEPTCFPMPFEVGVNPASADKFFGYFQKALRQAGTDEVRSRVEKASIGAYRAILEVSGQFEVRDGRLRVVFPPKYGAVVADYKALTRKYGQTRAEEWETIDRYYALLDKATADGYPAAQLENATWRLIVLPKDNGRVVELWHKPSQRHLLVPPDFRSLRHLFENLTLNELVEQGDKSAREFDIRQESAALLLTQRLKDGTELQRRIDFDERNPKAVRFHTQITNGTNAAGKFQFRVDPQLNTGRVTKDSQVVTAYVKDAAWFAFNEQWHGGDGPTRVQLEKAQGGGYAFYNRKDRFGVALQYDPASFARQSFWWSDTYPQMNLDLYTKAVELKPGESFAYQYELQFLTKPPQ